MTEDDEGYNILVADDEKSVRKSLRMTLERAEEFSAEIDTASDGDKALEKVEEKEYDLVLSDHKMPGMTGVELLKKVMKIQPDTIRILITGYRDLSIAKEAINEASVHEYIEKPWDNEELRFTIYQNLRRKEQREEEKVEDVDDVKEALKTIEKYQQELADSPSDSPGKEMLVFEFDSGPQFNKFSFKLKNIKNAKIEDVDVFEHKYIIRISLYPSTYGTIK